MIRGSFETPEDYRDNLQATQWLLPEGRSVKAQCASRDADMVDLLMVEWAALQPAKSENKPIRNLTSIFNL